MTSITRCILLLACCLLLVACTTFDKTNIRPGQRVLGPGFSFQVPTEASWFTVEYGTSHRLRLRQLNNEDSYIIVGAINRGPYNGMYNNADTHLRDFQRHHQLERKPAGRIELHHEEWKAPHFGELCIRYRSAAEDWAGRNRPGPTIVDIMGLVCPHPFADNVLVRLEISRRYEPDAPRQDLPFYAWALFKSLKYHALPL